MEEIWIDVKNYIGYYQVSNYGRVKSLSRVSFRGVNNKPCVLKERILKLGNDSPGYLFVILYKDDNKKTFRVHRLIAEAFIPNPEGKSDVNHINGIKTDNNLSNLEWNTRSENLNHAFKTGLKITQGERHPWSKLVKEQVLEIKTSNLLHRELSEIYNVSVITIGDIKRGKSWKHI